MDKPLPPAVDADHEAKRARLSTVALGLLVVGVPLGLIGLWRFAGPFLSGGPPDLNFGRAATGMFLAFAGAVMTMIGLQLLFLANAGKVLRYQAGEALPVAMDATRHAAPVGQEVARGMARAVREGWDGAGEETLAGPKVMHSCGSLNDPDDRFCKGCGAPLADQLCPSCMARNDPDAKFCAHCGAALKAET